MFPCPALLWPGLHLSLALLPLAECTFFGCYNFFSSFGGFFFAVLEAAGHKLLSLQYHCFHIMGLQLVRAVLWEVARNDISLQCRKQINKTRTRSFHPTLFVYPQTAAAFLALQLHLNVHGRRHVAVESRGKTMESAAASSWRQFGVPCPTSLTGGESCGSGQCRFP